MIVVNKRNIIVISTLIISLFLASGLSKQQAVQQLVIHGTLNNHYNPIKVDDSYSKEVFNLYLKRLDPSKRFLTKEDVVALSIFKYSIDDNIERNHFKFFNHTQKIYTKRLKYIKKNISSYFDTPLDFSLDEFLESDSDKRDYLSSLDELKDYWKKSIKYQILSQYISLKEAAVSDNTLITATFDAELEKKSREKVKKEFNDTFTRLSEESIDDHRNYYFDTLINVFDTHTNYFPPEKKADFDINISGKLEGIGAVLREEDGFIKVVRIVPGSASWKQGELKAEDLILKVAQGNKESVDLVGARVREAVKLIRGKKGSEVRLTVKHVTGEIKEIPIIRDIVTIEETYTKFSVIHDDRYDKRFGYIYIPKFYRDFKNSSGKNTTDDVRNALNELRLQQVDGILLDLRNNEGGALVDAVNTAGLFIKEGPVVQIKGLSPAQNVLKDRDRSLLYDGPLVILINNYSASASEILAAALQDFRRAVIVGSNSFGKGTVQTFIDLDRMNPAKTAFFNPLGSIKLTIQKFYRINGGSTQNKGVIPDITLPDASSHLDVGERHLDYALPFDTISPTTFTPWSRAPLNTEHLASLSQQRLSESEPFQNLIKHIHFIQERFDDTLLSLHIDTAISKKISTSSESKAYSDSIKEFDFLSINIPHQKRLNDAQKESYKQWSETIKKDLYIMESCSILNDVFQTYALVTKE